MVVTGFFELCMFPTKCQVYDILPALLLLFVTLRPGIHAPGSVIGSYTEVR